MIPIVFLSYGKPLKSQRLTSGIGLLVIATSLKKFLETINIHHSLGTCPYPCLCPWVTGYSFRGYRAYYYHHLSYGKIRQSFYNFALTNHQRNRFFYNKSFDLEFPAPRPFLTTPSGFGLSCSLEALRSSLSLFGLDSG